MKKFQKIGWLFDFTGITETESMIEQIFNTTLAKGEEWSRVKLDSDGGFGLVKNSLGYKLLISEGWAEEKEEDGKTYCKLTQKTIDKLGEREFLIDAETE